MESAKKKREEPCVKEPLFGFLRGNREGKRFWISIQGKSDHLRLQKA